MPIFWLPKRFGLLFSVIVSVAFAWTVADRPTVRLVLKPIITSGLEKPIYVTHAGDGSGRLFVVEQVGRVRVIKQGVLLPEPYLDISAQVTCCQEQGLLSIAFDPNYDTTGRLYANYTNLAGDTIVARFEVADPALDVADLLTVTSVISIAQPYYNHNGGQIQFGPLDGYLYIGMGDGGGIGDPDSRGQSLNTLLGKLLRIDVHDVLTYSIPATNPFTQTIGVRPEIWDYGLRNPWRFSFDRANGDLYIADVGVVCYEEINFEPAGSQGGLNYGWRWMEGLHAFNRDEALLCTQPKVKPSGMVLPVVEYPHTGYSSITGGYVYRGAEYPALVGWYIYGDFGTGQIWAVRPNASQTWSPIELLDTPYMLSSFGEDEKGEVYVVSYSDGHLYQLTGSN